MKVNMLFSLIFLILTPLYLSCDCSDQLNDVTSNKSFLHSFAIMNMDHLYYGVPFYGSPDHVYFHYSEDFPCKCENLTISKNVTANITDENKHNLSIETGKTSRKLKTTKIENKKNLRNNEEKMKKSYSDENELKSLEDIYQKERNRTIADKMFNNATSVQKNLNKKTPEIKFIEKESPITVDLTEGKNESIDETMSNKYLFDIDNYYENLLKDSVSDFEDALKHTLRK